MAEQSQAIEEIKLKPKYEAFIDNFFFTCKKDPTKAYMAVYEKAKKDTASKLGRELLQKLQKTPYFGQKNEEYSRNCGITFQKQLEDLEEIKTRCMNKQPKMVWERNERGKPELMQKEDEDGNLIWEFDSRGAIASIQELNKMLGYHAPEKHEVKNLNFNFNYTPPTETVEAEIIDA